MRAIAVNDFGETPEMADLPVPEPGPGDIQVQLKAAGINPFDAAIANGALKDVVKHKFPLVLGIDGAGIVTKVADGVTAFRPGDRVYGQFNRFLAGLGSYAEYSLVRAGGIVARMGEGMNFEQAAALPVATTTGWNLVRTARVDEDQRVLVVGATGGVGQATVQFAALQGARVIATAAPDAAAMMVDLGATKIVDHTAGSVADQVSGMFPDGVDVVIDIVGGSQAADLAKLVKTGGVFISAKGAADADALAQREIRGSNFDNRTTGEQLAELAELFDAARIKVTLRHVVPLEDAAAALQRIVQGGARGKTVIRI